jgi:predicted nicotinamide N-methyase
MPDPTLPTSAAALAVARLRLRARLERRFALYDETIRCGPLTLRFTRVEDPQAVLDAVTREERAGREPVGVPYWAELWDSSIGVATFLATRGWGAFDDRFASLVDPVAPDVLDLGCGMGLTALASATLGGRVLAGDIEPPALLFARYNTLAMGSRARRIDWQRDRLGERFDVIVGADVLYERAQWDHLEPFFRHHLRPRGSVLLAEPSRTTSDSFAEWISDRGWSFEQHLQPVPTHPRPIRLFVLRAGNHR